MNFGVGGFGCFLVVEPNEIKLFSQSIYSQREHVINLAFHRRLDCHYSTMYLRSLDVDSRALGRLQFWQQLHSLFGNKGETISF